LIPTDVGDPEQVEVAAELDYKITNGEVHKRLIQKLKEVLHKIHCNNKICYCNDHIFPDKLFLDRAIPLAGVAHQLRNSSLWERPKNLRCGCQLQGA
jgi:hypothetical protein